MKLMNKLLRAIKKDFPRASLQTDNAETPAGSSFLDIETGGYRVVVEARANGSFGLTGGREGVYGEGPDETYPDVSSALRRVLWLLQHQANTSPPLADQLRHIRAKRRLTQEELARRLGVKQSSVSKLEGRGETVSLRKLQELLAAMGGQLTLRVSFVDSGEIEELSLGELQTGTHG